MVVRNWPNNMERVRLIVVVTPIPAAAGSRVVNRGSWGSV